MGTEPVRQPARADEPGFDLVVLQSVHALGGSERHTIDLLRHLAGRSWRVAFVEAGLPIVSDHLSAWRDRIRFVNTPLPMRGNTPDGLRQWRELLGPLAARCALVVKPWYFEADLPFLRLVRAQYRAMAVIEHSMIPARRPWSRDIHFAGRPRTGLWWYRDCLLRWRMSRVPDRAIAVSAAVGRGLVDHALTPGRRVVVCPNGVDTAAWRRDVPAGAAFRERYRIPGEAHVFGCVGRLAPEKGLELAIKAFARVCRRQPDRALALCLVGDGRSRQALEQLAQTRGVADRVIFTGVLGDQAERVAAYSAIDTLLLPSHHRHFWSGEAFGLVLVEAMACECLVVASGFAGVPEVVRDPAGGRLVRTRDPRAWATAMEEDAVMPRGLRQERGRGARAFAQQAHELRPRMLGLERALAEVCGVAPTAP